MTRTARRLSALVATVLAVGLTSGLAGCSGSPNAAAVVDGRVITQAEVERTYTELAPLLNDARPAVVLQILIIAPDIEAAAAENGLGVSDDEARALLEQVEAQSGTTTPTDFGPGAIQVARSELASQALSNLENGQEILTGVTETIAARDIEVNPQYGTFNPDTTAVDAISWPWVAAG